MTKKELDQECKNITIIIDSREKENLHIRSIFDRCDIKYVIQSLKYGDYSFFSNNTGESFEKNVVIERKNSLDELSQNFTKNRIRFENEMEKAKEDNCNISLIIENNNFNDVLIGNYRSNFKVKSYIASLMTFKYRYNLDYIFLSQEDVANYIYNSFKYYYREILKKELKRRVIEIDKGKVKKKQSTRNKAV